VPPSILLVDDEESIRTFVQVAFLKAGYRVVVAPDGPEALEIIDQHEPFDLFIVDIIMPRMRGDELGRRIRARNPSAKLLYFTGYVGHLFDERKQAWTDEPFVAKPVDLDELLNVVSQVLFGGIEGRAALVTT